LTDRERERVIEHIANPDVLTTLLPPGNFIFRGFTVVRAVDVTESEITSALERDLIDQESIFSADGFKRLQSRLRTLFGQPELKASLAALQGDKVLILNDGHTSEANCLFTNSSHIPLTDLKHSVWLQSVDQEDILRIPDLSKEPNLCPAEQEAVDHGVRCHAHRAPCLSAERPSAHSGSNPTGPMVWVPSISRRCVTLPLFFPWPSNVAWMI
jgi:hypothetical protein